MCTIIWYWISSAVDIAVFLVKCVDSYINIILQCCKIKVKFGFFVTLCLLCFKAFFLGHGTQMDILFKQKLFSLKLFVKIKEVF